MKKILVFLIITIILVTGLVSAVDVTSRFRSSTGAAFTEISTNNDFSSPNSLRLFASKITSYPPTNEARFRINLNHSTTLGDLQNISWMQYIEKGYISHVDILLDINHNGIYDGTGGGDDALVFEYAKVAGPSDCDDVGDYPNANNGIINTFGDKGIVNDSSWAWLTSGPAGGCVSPSTEFFWHTLSAWKSGVLSEQAHGKTISGTTKVIALEIEVDGWIAESEAYIDDVKINGILIENFDGAQQVDVEIIGLTLVSISPITLDFGSLEPGTFDNPAINGPIVFDATGSNTNISISVTAVTGFPFATNLKLDGANPTTKSWNFICSQVEDICIYTTQSTVPTLSIPTGAVIGPKTGQITYTITGSPP